MRWVYAVGTPPDYPDLGPQECTNLRTAGGGSGGGSGDLWMSPPGRLTVSGAALGGTDASGRILAGIAPAGTTRVTITARGDGSTTEALLGPVITTEVGPRPGDRLFGSFFPGEPNYDMRYDVTAYAADGAILDHVRS